MENRAKRTIIYATIGLILGAILSKEMAGDSTQPQAIMTLMFIGVPFGWSAISRFLGSIIVVPSLPVMACCLMAKLIGSVFLGWIILLIEIGRILYDYFKKDKTQ